MGHSVIGYTRGRPGGRCELASAQGGGRCAGGTLGVWRPTAQPVTVHSGFPAVFCGLRVHQRGLVHTLQEERTPGLIKQLD